jgi:hypothetical protein
MHLEDRADLVLRFARVLMENGESTSQVLIDGERPARWSTCLAISVLATCSPGTSPAISWSSLRLWCAAERSTPQVLAAPVFIVALGVVWLVAKLSDWRGAQLLRPLMIG